MSNNPVGVAQDESLFLAPILGLIEGGITNALRNR